MMPGEPFEERPRRRREHPPKPNRPPETSPVLIGTVVALLYGLYLLAVM